MQYVFPLNIWLWLNFREKFVSLKTSVFTWRIRTAQCTFMHLYYLPATDFPTSYYFAEKLVHSRNIISYEAHILSETEEREKEKKKRKCNAFHVIRKERTSWTTWMHESWTTWWCHTICDWLRNHLVFNEAKSHRAITNSKKYNQHYSARRCAILFYLLNVNRPHFLNTKINIRWPTKMLFQMSDRNMKTINIDCFVV